MIELNDEERTSWRDISSAGPQPRRDAIVNRERVPENTVGAPTRAESPDLFCCIDLHVARIRVTALGGIREETECAELTSTRRPSVTRVDRLASEPQRLDPEARWSWILAKNAIPWVHVSLTSTQFIGGRSAAKRWSVGPARWTSFPLHRNRAKALFLAPGSRGSRQTVDCMRDESSTNLPDRRPARAHPAQGRWTAWETASRFIRILPAASSRGYQGVHSFTSNHWTDR